MGDTPVSESGSLKCKLIDGWNIVESTRSLLQQMQSEKDNSTGKIQQKQISGSHLLGDQKLKCALVSPNMSRRVGLLLGKLQVTDKGTISKTERAYGLDAGGHTGSGCAQADAFDVFLSHNFNPF